MLDLPKSSLPRRFYELATVDIAQRLIGQVILSSIGGHEVCGGWIVETEAYLATNDPASHSARGLTRRNASMFLNAGRLYVYSIHAKHCLNVVTEKTGVGSAVLIRAIEPVWGIERMQQRRQQSSSRAADDLRHLTRGPGMLCQAIGITTEQDGIDLVSKTDIWLAPWQHRHALKIQRSQRIGLSKAQHRRLRFFLDRNRFVSGRSGDHSQRPTESLARHQTPNASLDH